MRTLGRNTQEPLGFQSNRRTVFLLKIWAPLLIFISIIVLFKGDLIGWWLLFGLPSITLLFFHLSLAVVQLRNGVLRYRRLFGWKTIHRKEVISIGVLWPNFIGYIKLTHSVLPWGKLYFVLNSDVGSNPFGRGDSGLLQYLTDESAQDNRELAESSVAKNRTRVITLLFAAAFGVMSSIAQIAGSRYLPQFSIASDQPTFISVQLSFLALINDTLSNMPIGIAFFAMLVVLAVFTNYQRGWAFAFLAGILAPHILAHFLT